MNLKVSFSPVLALLLVVGLSACAKKAPQISQPVLLDTQASIPTDPSVIDELEVTKDKGEAIEIVEAPEIGVLDRVRQGFQLPDIESKHVTQFEKWSSEHNTYLKGLFSRGTPFLFHIVEEIEKRNLPMELALLPAVESAYRPTAVSRSKAVGLWQFIPATGREFGLRQDWWYDGRQDALESTKAALDYLTQLHKMFDGDWFLALAAYNAGPGTVSRAVKANKAKGRDTQYQDLALRTETKRYIPKLIALKNIINDPQKFGVDLPVIKNRPYFDIVKLNGQIDIKKFAQDADIVKSELKHLNAGFKRWATSPDGPHRLLVPIKENGDISQAVLAAQRAPEINYSNHKISEGDSLSTIAHRYGVSVDALQTSNNLAGSNIRAGKNLLIPVRASSLKSRSEIASASTSAAPQAKGNSEGTNQEIVHHVKQGDTLWSISLKYNVQVNKLLSWNNISRNQVLRLDQTLLVMPN